MKLYTYLSIFRRLFFFIVALCYAESSFSQEKNEYYIIEMKVTSLAEHYFDKIEVIVKCDSGRTKNMADTLLFENQVSKCLPLILKENSIYTVTVKSFFDNKTLTIKTSETDNAVHRIPVYLSGDVTLTYNMILFNLNSHKINKLTDNFSIEDSYRLLLMYPNLSLNLYITADSSEKKPHELNLKRYKIITKQFSEINSERFSFQEYISPNLSERPDDILPSSSLRLFDCQADFHLPDYIDYCTLLFF